MRLFTYLIIALYFLTWTQEATAQGCVAIRGMSSCAGSLGGSAGIPRGEFLAGMGFRYFKSFRHYRGTEQEKYRLAEGTEVINHSYFMDLSLSYGITDRWYGNVVLPLVYNTRSSMYEHGGNPPNGLGERHQTSSQGLADVRLGVGYWLFNPEKAHHFNYALGVGMKLPTGRYDYTDTFYNQGENRDETRQAVVDQSIQPGDGGTGITLDVQGYHMLSPVVTLTANLFYLSNFQETNGVLTRSGRSEFSCPDQYGVRLGSFWNTSLSGTSAYVGGRLEGIPAEDIIGGSAGYRRPGYAVSVEPGISYNKGNYSFNLSLPVALVRNRVQSFEDKQQTRETGEYTQGDAAFADYLLNFTFFYRIGKKRTTHETITPTWIDVQEMQ